MLPPAWDLIIQPPLPGELNMAVDRWLLLSHPRPVLRLYEWEEPTVSIGYRQKFKTPANFKKIAERFPMVIRPTGGGYLLHADEITFSIVFPETHKMASLTILEIYARLRASFTKTARKFDLIAGTNRGKSRGAEDDCLAAPGRHEPVEKGLKWMAAAQVHRRGAVLEHGSIFWDDANWPDCFPNKPFFVGKNAGINKNLFRSKLIENIAADIFSGSCGAIYEFSPADWDEINSLVPEFKVDNLF